MSDAVRILIVLVAVIAVLSVPTSAAPPTPPVADASCGNPAAEQRLIEEQRVAHERRALSILEQSFGERLRAALPGRLAALEVGLRRGLEVYAFRESFRKTTECLARTRPEPFCGSVLAGDPGGCEVVQAPGGPVNIISCRVFSAIRAGVTRGSTAPCESQGELAPVCRMIVRGRYDCGALGLGADAPATSVCRLLTDPGRCDAPELAKDQGCAMMRMVQALRGDPDECALIPEDEFPRLRATCDAVEADAPGACLPSTPTTPDLAACAAPEPWAPTLRRDGDVLHVTAAAANVLSRDAACVVELHRPAEGTPQVVATLPLGSVPPGHARIRERRTTLPPSDAEPTAHVRCTWARDRRSLILRLRTFEHPSLDHPGSGDTGGPQETTR